MKNFLTTTMKRLRHLSLSLTLITCVAHVHATELTMNAVIRLQDHAVCKLSFDDLNNNSLVRVYDNQSGEEHYTIDVVHHDVLISEIQLNREYDVLIDNNLVAVINTHAQPGAPIHVSNDFSNALADWTQLENKPRAIDYLNTRSDLDQMERLYFLQRFYDADQTYPNEEFWSTTLPWETDNWTQEDGSGSEIDFDDIIGLEEIVEGDNQIKNCRCNYVLRLNQRITPGFPNATSLRNDPEVINHSREYFNEGSNVYSHFMQSDNGPSKDYSLRIHVKKFNIGARSRQKGSLDNPTTGAINKSELWWLLMCDPALGQASIDEECACTKELQLNYRYDTHLKTVANELSCVACNKKGSAATVEDWASAVVVQGDKTTVLSSVKAELKSSCEDVGPIGTIGEVIKFVNSVVKILYPGSGVTNVSKTGGTVTTTTTASTPTKWIKQINGVATAIVNSSSVVAIKDGSCGTADADKTLFDGTTTVTLKSNEPVSLYIISASEIQVEAKRSGEARGIIASDYFISGVIQRNATTNEVAYCCSKKVGAYNLGSSGNAPLPLAEIQNEVGVVLDRTGPWNSPYDTKNPHTWVGVLVPHEVDILFGKSGCDDVKITSSMPRDNPLWQEMQQLNLHMTADGKLSVQNATISQYLQIRFYSLDGKLVGTTQLSPNIHVYHVESNQLTNRYLVAVVSSKSGDIQIAHKLFIHE